TPHGAVLTSVREELVVEVVLLDVAHRIVLLNRKNRPLYPFGWVFPDVARFLRPFEDVLERREVLPDGRRVPPPPKTLVTIRFQSAGSNFCKTGFGKRDKTESAENARPVPGGLPRLFAIVDLHELLEGDGGVRGDAVLLGVVVADQLVALLLGFELRGELTTV